ncbi:hypothetical protein [Ornithinimicrobium avium]|nr:hypothetical protein [Ornithinimicrobium avium]
MGENGEQVVPSVEEIARLVGELVDSEWPTTLSERSAWFERHGIATEGAERLREEHGSESWHSGDPGAPWPAVGWHVFENEFVGISWFLWHGLREDVVPGLAEELRARFVEMAGEPMDEIRREGEDYRFTANWQKGGRSIDMYLHGGPVLEGQFHEHPVVQLHVDHVERARRADETAALAQPVVKGRALGNDAAPHPDPRKGHPSP